MKGAEAIVRRSVRGITAPSFLLAAFLAVTPAAHAHGTLRNSTPAAGAHLSAAPRELHLTFTEAVELTLARVELTGPDGKMVRLGVLTSVQDSAQVVAARIIDGLVAGGYTVKWQIAGKDGHPVRGRFTFTIAPGATGLGVSGEQPARVGGEPGAGVTAPGQVAPPQEHHDPVAMPQTGTAFDAESPLYVIVRWLMFGGILIVVGAVAFHSFVLGFLRRKQSPDSPMLASASARAAVIGWWAAASLGILALVRLFVQSYALHGREQVLSTSLLASLLGRTVWGWGWLLQIVAIAVALLAFRTSKRRSVPDWRMAALAALLLALTPALSGHAVAVPRFAVLAVIADTAHVIGASGWLGSLLLVFAAGIPAAFHLPVEERGSAVAQLVNAFSPTALVFAAIAATTGVFAAWLHIGTISGLWQSEYGRTLLLKVGVLSIVALTGAYNWLRVKPTLGGSLGAARIRRSARAELAVAVVVLLITAVLVATPTAIDERMAARDPSAGGAMTMPE